MRLAWFSPFPPVRTGIAACSADLVAALGSRGHDVVRYPSESAHDFPWRHRKEPYDLVVYQFGNSSHHDYEWAYALRYPGLVVLHDTRLHHARAAFLLRERRVDDYRAEFRWNEPDVPAAAAELAIAGFDSLLYYDWPMTRALVASSRLTAVHGHEARAELLTHAPDLDERVASIRLGHGTMIPPGAAEEASARVRARYGIPRDAVVFGCFGGLTPEKRLSQILAALAAVLPYAPSARLLLAGAPAAHYDVEAEVVARGLRERVTMTGYLDADADVTEHLAACDVSLNLRWPTARETSGPWLRALAAGRATVITDLVHLGGVPSLDPRTWQMKEAVCIAVDIMDEDHSLGLAMRRLAKDPALRAQLGRAGQAWWRRQHSVEAMVEDYERVMADAAGRALPRTQLPEHLRDAGDRRLRALIAPFGLASPL